jgi:hypothetical protein
MLHVVVVVRCTHHLFFQTVARIVTAVYCYTTQRVYKTRISRYR